MAAPEPSNDRITSLPLVDLRLLTQSELYSLSLSNATHRLRGDDDTVIPKINRSFFNESAGSRKQTYSRLRLAPRNNDNASAPASSPHIPLPIPEPVDRENSQIIALLQQLFGVESLGNAERTHDDVETLPNAQRPLNEASVVPVQVEFKQQEFAPLVFQNVPIEVADGSQKKRKRGRPRKNENFEEEPRKVTVYVHEKSYAVSSVREGESKVVETVDKKRPVAKAVAVPVEDAGDPFGDELKRRIQGMETETQLLEFLETLNGEWGSQRKKRRFIQATVLGHSLPAGWKIVLCLQRRAGRATIICRRYVSPDGLQFESYEEALAHLLSSLGVQDRSNLESSYPDGSQPFSSSTNLASESQNVGQVPTGDMKTNYNANSVLDNTSIHSHHEKQATISSPIGNERLNTSDGNFTGDLAFGCRLGGTSGGAFKEFDHQIEDKLLLKADKNDANSVQGCSLAEERVCNVRNEKSVGATEASDAACNLYIPLVFTTPFSDNNTGISQFSDEINADTSTQGGTSNFAIQDRDPERYETVPCGNKQAHADNNRFVLPVKLVEEPVQKTGFESMLAPNSEGKIFPGPNSEDRLVVSSLEGTGIGGDGKPLKDDQQQIMCSRYQPEIKDVSADVKLQRSSEGCSLFPSHNELEHASINCTDRTQTSMLKDSAEGNFFDDFPISSLDERTCFHSGYIHNVSFNSCMQDASDFGRVDFAPNIEVAKDVSDNHVPANEEVATSCLLERSSLNDQNCPMDNLLLRISGSNSFTLTGNQHAPAFHDNVSNISAGTLKAVDAGVVKPQLGIASCSNVNAVDAYTTTTFMQGRSQGCVSVPLGGSILNQFDKQSDDVVSKAHISCSSEKAKSEAEIFHTDSIGLPKFR